MYATPSQRPRVLRRRRRATGIRRRNGLGSNTSIQDSYNLAWKLARVLRGRPAPALLDTYAAERAPVGRQIVLRANKSIGEFGQIFEALGLPDAEDPDADARSIEARKANTPEAAEQRARCSRRWS